MIALPFKLENFEDQFSVIRDRLQNFQFTLGGNWDYDHGYFDRALDEPRKVWLRIPFSVTKGNLDSEAEEVEALVRLERPFVIKHLYNEGLDPEASFQALGGLTNQFQEPLEKDAQVEDHWVMEAKQLLHEVEKAFEM